MATARSVTFQADKDSLFAATIRIVRDAGYPISETDDAARRINYYADTPRRGLFASHRFEVTITVSGESQTTATTAMLSMKTVGITVTPRSNGAPEQNPTFEGEVIDFIITQLKKRYPVVASATTIANAPGAGGQKTGCLVMLGFLGLLAAGSGCGFLMLLAALLH